MAGAMSGRMIQQRVIIAMPIPIQQNQTIQRRIRMLPGKNHIHNNDGADRQTCNRANRRFILCNARASNRQN